MCQNQLNAACIPFNFVQLEDINEKTRDFHTTLLYATLYFQIQKSKLFTHGTKTIARSREQLASFLNLSPSKLDKMIMQLESLNWIRKTVSTWRGKKRLFISSVTEAPDIEVHFRKLMFLTQYTGNFKASLLWAKIAFALNKSTIERDGLTWCTLKRETLAKLLCVSLRTVDSLIDSLVEKGLVQVRNFVWHGKRRLHFTIPVTIHTQIVEELKDWLNKKESTPTQETSIEEEKQTSATEENRVEEYRHTPFLFKKEPKPHFCAEEPAKTEKSIRLNKNIQYKNNNTISSMCSKKEEFDSGDINLNYIASELTRRQLHFLQAAFTKTLKEARLAVANEKELFEEIKYSILNPQQRRAVTTFKHAVSRCMQLLRQRTWRTPFGFNRYTNFGAEIKAYREAQLQAHEARKKEECDNSDSNGVFKISIKMREITEECIRWAQQLRMYIAEMNVSSSNTQDLEKKIEFVGNKVLELINKGADRVAIKPYLPI